MSDDEETLFESERQMGVDAIAQRLRQVADGLDAGAIHLGHHVATPTSPVNWEEEYSVGVTDEGTTYELELEMKWAASRASGQSDQPASGNDDRGALGRFELFTDASDRFRFRLKAGNGEIIASSEAYETKTAALKGVESVRINGPTGRIDDQTLSL